MNTTPAAPAARWLDAGLRPTVLVRGPDAQRFIDGFTTAAIGSLEPGSGAEGFFADAKGQVLALAAILRTDDGVWIDAFPGGSGSLAEHLERYHIRERLEIVDATATRTNIVVAGPAAAAMIGPLIGMPVPTRPWGHVHGAIGGVPVAVVAVPWAGPGGVFVQAAAADRLPLVTALEAAGCVAAPLATLEQLRIAAGWPAPCDIPAKTLPQELGRDAAAISFTKGCYLGQETVARLDALGHVNRRLVGLAAMQPLTAGTAVRAAGVECGVITSAGPTSRAGGWLGLAVLPVKACPAGAALDVGGVAVRVVELPLSETLPPPPPPSARGGEVVFTARRFRVVRIAEPDGGRDRDVVEHPGSVVVIPLVDSAHICLVEVVRVAVGKTLVELPAGTLDRVETLAEAAARELAEETGYRAGRLSCLGEFWMSPGILHERMHLFVAEDLVPGPQALEPGEHIRTRVVPAAEAVAMCLDGRIEDAKTVAGLLLWAARAGTQA
jgi:ADP-ribose pyrophosphatase